MNKYYNNGLVGRLKWAFEQNESTKRNIKSITFMWIKHSKSTTA